MIWKDRKYINPRKRVFKNIDTNEILNLEIQDDPNNIEEESETPLNSHNLNLSQQQLLDDMSKTYVGTSITGPTVSGYGTIHKLYGNTIEEGTGEKSPSNPYALRCVADDVNLFDKDKLQITNAWQTTYILGANKTLTVNSTATSGVAFVRTNTISLEAGTYIFSADIIGDFQEIRVFKSGVVQPIKYILNKSDSFVLEESYDIYFEFYVWATATSNTMTIKNIKVQKGSTATPYSPYGEGTVEIISQNGDQQSSNIVATKPLCCLKDSEGNAVAQDYIDYHKGVVHRECGYRILDGTEDWQASGSYGEFYRFGLAGFTDTDTSKKVICSHFNQLQDWNVEENIVLIGSVYNTDIWFITNQATTVQAFKGWLNSNPITIVYELTTPTEEALDCSNKIVQYVDETTVSNRDEAKIEVSLTNNKAISEVNGELGGLRDDVNKINEYSTEEQVIGTWIDGKPLYRKVYDNITINSSETVIAKLSGIKIQMISGWLVRANDGFVQPIGSYSSSESIYTSRVFCDNAVIKVQANSNYNTGEFKARVVIEYTKTTD